MQCGTPRREVLEVKGESILELYAGDGGGSTLCLAGPVFHQGNQLYAVEGDKDLAGQAVAVLQHTSALQLHGRGRDASSRRNLLRVFHTRSR